MPPAPVTVTPLGQVSAATVVWRRRGRASVTVAVKATFTIVPEARMTPIAPDPIVTGEQPDPTGRGLRAAGDLAPYLGQADVLLTGHAELPPSFSAPEVPVWLAVVRDGVMRIDKRLELDASARVGSARAHVHIDGMGPLSREWPKRSQLLGGADPRRLQGTDLDVPDGLDWTYFQAAPADQRTDPLQGDEWLVLGGIFMRRPKLRTQLPEARAVARVYRRGHAPPRAGEPIALLADTLQIDADRHCVSIVWRGHAPAEEADLGAIQIVAGIELPGREVAWKDPFASSSAQSNPGPQSQPSPQFRPGPQSNPGPQSMPGASPPASSRPDGHVLVAPRAAPESPFEGTMAIDEEVLAKLTAALPAPSAPQRGPAKTPGPPPPAPPAPTAAAPPAPPRPAMDNPLEGTVAVPAEIAAKLKASVATPFQARNAPQGPARAAPPQNIPAPPKSAPTLPPAPEDNPLEGTMALPTEVALKLKGSVATPFERRAAPHGPAPAPPPSSPAPPKSAPAPPKTISTPPKSAPEMHRPVADNPLEGTMALSTEVALKLKGSIATPFEGRAAPHGPARAAPPPSATAPAPPFHPAPSSFDQAVPGAPAPLPFAPVQPSYGPAPSPFAPASTPLAPAPFVAAPLVPAPWTPALAAAPAAPGASAALTLEELAAWPPGLGAEFLAAMADAGSLV